MLQNIYACFCRNTERFVNDQPSNKTPLLSAGGPHHKGHDAVTNQPANLIVSATSAGDGGGGGFYPVEKQPQDVKPKSSGKPRKINVGFTNVKAVDKRLQDSTKVYNEYFGKYDDLQCLHGDLCSAFETENPDHSLDVAFQILRHKTRDCPSLSINKKSQNGGGYTRVDFDPRELPSDALNYLTKFNSVSKLAKELSDKGPKLSDAVQLVLKDETELRRDVLAASMGVEGPECMKMCIGGINELRKVPGFIEEILRRSKKINKRCQRALQKFTVNDDDMAQMSDVIVPRVHRSDTTSSSGSGEDKNGLLSGLAVHSATKKKVDEPVKNEENKNKVKDNKEKKSEEQQKSEELKSGEQKSDGDNIEEQKGEEQGTKEQNNGEQKNKEENNKDKNNEEQNENDIESTKSESDTPNPETAVEIQGEE